MGSEKRSDQLQMAKQPTYKQIFNTFSMIKDNINKTYTFAKNDKIMIWVRVNVFEIASN